MGAFVEEAFVNHCLKMVTSLFLFCFLLVPAAELESFEEMKIMHLTLESNANKKALLFI